MSLTFNKYGLRITARLVWESVAPRARMESDIVFLQQKPFNASKVGSTPSFALLLDETEEVNQPRSNVYIFTCLPILCVTLLVNSLAVVVIRRKDKSCLNRLIIYDKGCSILREDPYKNWPKCGWLRPNFYKSLFLRHISPHCCRKFLVNSL